MLRLLRPPAPITPETPDEVLVRRAQKGEHEAFKVLFERHVLSVRRFLRDLIRDTDAADDATQETFTRAHVQLPRLGDHDRFKPWVFGIARNVAFEVKRVRQHEPLEADDDEVPAAVIPAPDPERLLLDRELEGQFASALSGLSEHRRAALLLRLDHGLSYDDIAAAMGWSLPMVKNEIHRARLAMRASLLPHLGGPTP
ncbi:MAG: RNA polymerase sigma factor [Myxococcaceae bacterium]|nr:RNA polymerase sigma factor [Myxococcaceae bacterium]